MVGLDAFVTLKIFAVASRYLLSLAMEARGEYEQSIDMGATAVHLEQNSPIVTYYSIIRVL